MVMELESLVVPEHTAVVTSECQNGVVGEHSLLPELAAAAQQTVLPNAARIVTAARACGVRVIHCVALRRPDGLGANRNARLFAAMAKAPVTLAPGSEAAQIVPELGATEDDLILSRLHGLSPMAGTDLDPILRNLGVRTVVVLGVSLNIAITNLVMDAVNAGYQVVVARDAVAGVPASYGEAVLEHTLSLLATVVTTEQICAAWESGR